MPGGRDDSDPPAPAGDRITPETYLGTTRGTAGARPGLITYPDPGRLATGECRLAGPWGAEEQKVTAAAAGASIVLAYQSREVNLVMTPPRGGAVDVQVEVDGRPLPPELRTDDTVVDGSGATYVHVDHDGLYRLVLSPDVAEHTLRLIARQPRSPPSPSPSDRRRLGPRPDRPVRRRGGVVLGPVRRAAPAGVPGTGRRRGRPGGEVERSDSGRSVRATAVFVLGFAVVFAALGAAAGWSGARSTACNPRCSVSAGCW